MYEIETEAPPPKPQEQLQQRRVGRRTLYPWHTLQTSASFFVPYGSSDARVLHRRLTQALREARQRTHDRVPEKWAFVWAERTHEGKKGLRVWRTK